MTAKPSQMKSAAARIAPIAQVLIRLPVVGVLVRAGSKTFTDRSKDMAASIAFFTFLSLFPLILGVFAVGGHFLSSETVQVRVRDFLFGVLPASAEFLMSNVESLVRMRGAAGFASVALLLWSASKMVGAMVRGINNALEFKRPYAVYFSPVRNFVLTVSVTILVLAAMAFAPLVEILADLNLGFFGRAWNSFFSVAASHVNGIITSILLMSAIYLLVPYKRLSLKEMLPGVLVAALAVKVGKELFSLYISNASRFDAVYGSVSSIIVLLIWLYFCSLVVLYSTEVICVYRKTRQDSTLNRQRDTGCRAQDAG